MSMRSPPTGTLYPAQAKIRSDHAQMCMCLCQLHQNRLSSKAAFVAAIHNTNNEGSDPYATCWNTKQRMRQACRQVRGSTQAALQPCARHAMQGIAHGSHNILSTGWQLAQPINLLPLFGHRAVWHTAQQTDLIRCPSFHAAPVLLLHCQCH